jgi:type III secretory pathway component EscR
MAEVFTASLLAMGMSYIVNVSLPFTMSLYLAFYDEWLDLTC